MAIFEKKSKTDAVESGFFSRKEESDAKKKSTIPFGMNKLEDMQKNAKDDVTVHPITGTVVPGGADVDGGVDF